MEEEEESIPVASIIRELQPEHTASQTVTSQNLCRPVVYTESTAPLLLRRDTSTNPGVVPRNNTLKGNVEYYEKERTGCSPLRLLLIFSNLNTSVFTRDTHFLP
jgi:tellurite resistance-related uncharacterized protein